MEQPLGSEIYALSGRALLQIAHEACEGSRTRDTDAIVSVVFSAFYVEAMTNELLHNVTSVDREVLEDEPGLRRLRDLARAAELERSSVQTKLSLIALSLTDEPLDWGRLPYQDLELLVSLRHYIAHSRPETLKIGTRDAGDPSFPQEALHALLKTLIERKIVPPPPSRFVLSPLLAALGNRSVAVWALNTALAVVEELADAMPSGLWRDRVFLDHDFSRVGP